MNNSFRRLRIKEFSNLADFIKPSEGRATCLGNVNRHGNIKIEPGTKITNTVWRGCMVESPTKVEDKTFPFAIETTFRFFVERDHNKCK